MTHQKNHQMTSDADLPRELGRHSLGDNLYLWVRSPTNREFVIRYREAGKRHDKNLGSARKITLAQARAAADRFNERLATTKQEQKYMPPVPAPESTTASAQDRKRNRKLRSFVRASTIGKLPSRIEVIEQTIAALTHQLATLTCNLQSLRDQIKDISAELPRLAVAIALPADERLAALQLPDLAPVSPPPAIIGDPATTAEPSRDQIRSAVVSYYTAKVAAWGTPTQLECSRILQHNGYWPGRSYSFMYMKIRPHWPARGDARRFNGAHWKADKTREASSLSVSSPRSSR
jgi:hypothetical protein